MRAGPSSPPAGENVAEHIWHKWLGEPKSPTLEEVEKLVLDAQEGELK